MSQNDAMTASADITPPASELLTDRKVDFITDREAAQVRRDEAADDDDGFCVGARRFRSRLLVGTGKYRDLEQTRAAIEASGAEVVTVAIRRTNLGQNPDEPNLLDVISPERYTILPNTAGCYTAEDAVRTCRLARELLGDHRLVKLEVLGDAKTLYPDMPETLKAAEILVAEGFEVMVYCSDDPLLAQRLEAIGVHAIMPLAAPIGSGLGIQNRYNIREIVENATVPVLVDAGVGTASDAAVAMELGCDGVLMNTAIALANHPVRMARAMRHAIIAGREAFRAGRMAPRRHAQASSPETGTFFTG
ncbi:MAG: thiazole synthase [Thioalkalivibrionaceae bacterium]